MREKIWLIVEDEENYSYQQISQIKKEKYVH